MGMLLVLQVYLVINQAEGKYIYMYIYASESSQVWTHKKGSLWSSGCVWLVFLLALTVFEQKNETWAVRHCVGVHVIKIHRLDSVNVKNVIPICV